MMRSALITLVLSGLLTANAQVAVTDEWVRLGDVAPVTGDAARVLVAPAPPPGEQLALDPTFLAAVAKRSGVLITLPADVPILVTRAGAPTPSTPQQAASAPIARQAPVPHGTDQMMLEGPPNPGWILVAAEPIARGDTLDRSHLRWADPGAIRSAPRNAVMDLTDAVGMELKRSLRTDAPLQTSDLKPAAVIRKGDMVQLVYASAGVRLTTSGLAQQDAGRGEPVRILNQYTKRTIEAVAYADGEARVGGR